MPAIVIPAPISSNHAAPVSAGGTGATTAAAARTNLDVYSKSEVTNAISQSTAIKRAVATGGPFTTGATVTFTISGSIPTWVYLRGRRWGYRSPLIIINVTEDAQTNDDNFFILRDASGENSVAKISWKGVSRNTLSMKIVSNSGGELYFDLFYT